MNKLTGQALIEDMTPAEIARAERVESVLPTLRAVAAEVDARGEFHVPHVKTLSDAGLLGLIVPEEYGGMGGGLRDLCAATFSLATACPSTALTFFFHCSSASRGLLALEALEEGLFDEQEAPVVKAFAEQVLHTMGREGKWLAYHDGALGGSATGIWIHVEELLSLCAPSRGIQNWLDEQPLVAGDRLEFELVAAICGDGSRARTD